MITKYIKTFLFLLFTLIFVTACSSRQAEKITLPEDEFSISDNFGDGYISKIAIEKANHKLTIIALLVEQWLEHYETNSANPKSTIRDFSIDGINILEKKSDSIYSNSLYLGVAGVKFSIIPATTPSDFAPFPGEEIEPGSDWWHLTSVFGYYQIGDFYYLRILPGWGT